MPATESRAGWFQLVDRQDPDLSVETTEGHRPSTSAADRLLVILAVLALLGGGLIGIGKILPQSSEAADATGTPQATGAASGSSLPSEPPLSLRTVTLNGIGPPRVEFDQPQWSGWVRALHRVRIVASPSAAGRLRHVLNPGDVAYVSEYSQNPVSDWLEVMAPVSGWLPLHSAGDPSVLRFEQHRLDMQALPDSIAPGPGGQFLMSSYVSGTNQWQLGMSNGIGAWTSIDAPEMVYGADSIRLAYGARHWLAVETSSRFGLPRMWIWQSDDGEAWQVLGEMKGLPSDSFGPVGIAGSDLGYVMTPFAVGDRLIPRKIWYSTDGEVWSERPAPIGTDRVVAASIGFYAYATNLSERLVAAFSLNGSDWSEVDVTDMDDVIGVAGSGERLVALDRLGDAIRTWTGTLDKGRLTWQRDQATEAAFEGAVVTGMSGSTGAIAMGWDRDTQAPMWWSNDAAGWHPHRLPATFGLIPVLGTASSGGYALAGIGSGPLNQGPVMWTSSGATTLNPEANPYLAEGPPLTRADCEQYTGELLDMMSNSGLAYATCRGNGDIQIRGYAVACENCTAFAPSMHNEARWLAEPDDHRLLHLAPIQSSDWGWYDGVLRPGLQPRKGWEGHWLSVIGHFDDPVSQSCRQDPTADELSYGGVAQSVRDCRSRFVVTSVEIES